MAEYNAGTTSLSLLPPDVVRNVFCILLAERDRSSALQLAFTCKANLALFRALQAVVHVPDTFFEALHAVTHVSHIISTCYTELREHFPGAWMSDTDICIYCPAFVCDRLFPRCRLPQLS
jgi:hypothetical protein